jgi:hypothetical protein
MICTVFYNYCTLSVCVRVCQCPFVFSAVITCGQKLFLSLFVLVVMDLYLLDFSEGKEGASDNPLCCLDHSVVSLSASVQLENHTVMQ